ncbi:MAG TPA: HAMP domain-containing sensor histidine kinase [Ignavibacteriales bacterium]|nr:HAMP domain-containing sensor histidine kinase [Ignavibacteriales bacterium]HOM66038.1 HAMP domain-containing sensor histidine kinase [Ignavibacteriales bacterium]HPD67530.1 HAMP domain-containing sensor histidine kinase [Ignavibacteriales bacterium]HPP33416.1 HAMP domain-containing sensor histidine kinase [Ignavibacteriales bacterium]HRR19286.1 HAMP domain-containing sensor histidine kinase [Ignavibacteriales bacterium]
MKKQFYHYLNNITKYYGNLELMKKNLDSAYTLALYLENYEAGILSDYYLQLARYYYTKGDLSQTITYYMLCIRNSKKNLEKFATNNYTSLIDLSNIYFDMGFYTNYLINIYKNLFTINLSDKDRYLYGIAYNNIGLIYEKNHIIDSALIFFEKAYKFRKENIKNQDSLLYLGHSLIYIARNQIKLAKYKEAEKNLLIAKNYFEKYLSLNIPYDDLNREAKYRLVNSYLLLAKLYWIKNEKIKSSLYLKLALDFIERSANIIIKDDIYILLSEHYIFIKEYNKAEKYLHLAKELSLKNNIVLNLIEIYRNLVLLYRLENNFDKYIEYTNQLNKLIKKNTEIIFTTSANLIQLTINESEKLAIIQEKIKEKERIQKNYIIYQILFLIVSILIIIYFILKDKKKKDLIKKLQHEKEKLEDLNKRKIAFSNYLAHEFKTPLNIIKGFTQKLSEELPNNVKIIKIIENVDRLNNFIDDFIEISNINDGKVKFELSFFSVNDKINLIVQKYERIAQEKALDIKFISDLSNDLYIETDEKKFYIILNDLIDNAIKFTDKGKVEIIVNTVKLKDDTIDFIIRILDTGIGIDDYILENIQNHIFDLPNKGYDNFGIGLSLPIIFSYTKTLGIGLKFNSKKNIGTVVELKFENIIYKIIKKENIDNFNTILGENEFSNIENINYDNFSTYDDLILLHRLTSEAIKFKNFSKIKATLELLYKIQSNHREFNKIYNKLKYYYENFDYDNIFIILETLNKILFEITKESNDER